MDEVAAALDAPVARYGGIHDAVSRLRASGVTCVVVDDGSEGVTTAGAVRRLQRESDAAVVLAVAPDEGTTAVTADVAAVVDRTTPTATARTLEEVRTDTRLDRAARRSSGAETLLREATESIQPRDGEFLEALADEVGTTVAQTRPYPVGWLGRYDPERRVVRPLTAAGIPASHLRPVPVEDGDGGPTASDPATTRAVDTEGGAAVFAERLDEHDRTLTAADGTHLLAVRIPLDPVAVLHLVADRPGGVPAGERTALVDLGAAIASATADSEESVGSDRLRLLADALAHELSNQVGAASLQLDLAEVPGDTEHFEHIARALDRLEDLTDETRALAREEPDRERTDLETVTESAWEAISTPNATLEVEDATLEVDTALVRLAMINLLRNAVEHGWTEDGSAKEGPSALQVEVGPVDDGEGFYVADDGTGIPPAERERVLEWGHSGNDGTGVGLGLVRLVARRHGWTVTVGESDGGGARIELGPPE